MSLKRYWYFKIFLVIIVLTIIYQLYTNAYNQHSNFNSIPTSSNKRPRGVIVTLMRSTNQSMFLTMNMINSVIRFHTIDENSPYPFLIFHDQNFTSHMQQHIFSCVLRNNKDITISFALFNFTTAVQSVQNSQSAKSIQYRLMCRFWIYDVFYHPAIRNGGYDYLMRMDDDSYISNMTKYDLFAYTDAQKLDYVYRAAYWESKAEMQDILKRFVNISENDTPCIYNNFFIIRLEWYYKSEQVQRFIRELIQDDLILRQYIGDGCVHAEMLQIDNSVRSKHIFDISYGHNYHVMTAERKYWKFILVKDFYEEINRSCYQLTVLRESKPILTRINMTH
ncbi:hypothetical protein I4U23_020577 [Adineta vaga]|nr:hypothetical protein I4U23_020577 [Adineta vaga]